MKPIGYAASIIEPPHCSRLRHLHRSGLGRISSLGWISRLYLIQFTVLEEVVWKLAEVNAVSAG
jgi:hypothetical protein